ncbi:MAG: BatD family protein [Candidatus Omnitrophica bacterium]|nr:BatD family protein [Candidatus Omnitrophota bacterium]MDD5670836.1 BatD family protein [Candidatus Omnitrophota bacterium]
MLKRVIITSALLYWVLVPVASAQEVYVDAKLSKTAAEINQEVLLTITITNAHGNVQAPRLPSFKDLDVYYTGRASQVTFVNNMSSNMVEFTYVVIPRSAGRFPLDNIEVLVGNARYMAPQLVLDVKAGQKQMVKVPPVTPTAPPIQQPKMASAQEATPNFQPDDDNIFVKAWVDKNSVYVNEQIVLTYSLYTRYDTRYEGFSEEPEMSGFWIEEFPMEREVQRETVRVNNKRYVKADIRKIALFPTAAAEYTIQPGNIKASIRQEPQNSSIFDEFFNDSFFSGSGFFSRREDRLLKPPPIRIEVKPLPEEGKPADFQGAVGRFQMVATCDKQQIDQNEPITVVVTIEGQGNIETLKQPTIPEAQNFKVYEANSSSQLFKTGNVIGGRKVFEIVFIPIVPGRMTIPKLTFSFFDPSQGRYFTQMTQDFQIDVKASDKPLELPQMLSQQEMFKKEISMEGKDIRYIEERLPNEIMQSWEKRIYFGLAATDVILTLLVLFGLWREYVRRLFDKDVGLKRRKMARSQAEAKTRRLKPLMYSKSLNDTMDFFEEVDRILTQYLSDKFNLPALATTRDDIQRELENTLGRDDPLFSSIVEVYQVCEEARFGKGRLEHGLKKDVLKILKQTIDRVERKHH